MIPEGIENKVASSGLLTIDLEDWLNAEALMEYDISKDLWQGFALKEKEFRETVKSTDWSAYASKNVWIHCSTDAVVPTWAYMLLASAMEPYAAKIVFGTAEEAGHALLLKKIETLDVSTYKGSRIVVKGCSNRSISVQAYIDLVKKLQPVVKSLMFGEPCSTVPLYKKKQL